MNIEFKALKLNSEFYLKFIFCCLIFTFIVMRLIAANHNFYFDRDEVRKLLRTSGFTDQQFIQLTYNTKPIAVAEILSQYQVPCRTCQPRPNLSALNNNLEHPPLYYTLLQSWLLGIGHLFSSKLFSTLIAIATIPAIYWLAQEIFNQPLVSLLSATLFATSPYLFAVSQHVSQYSLWSLLICLSTALFVRATKSNSKRYFVLYALVNFLGLYTHLFFILLILAQGSYLLFKRSWRLLQTYGISLLFAIASFTPWALRILSHREKFEETSGIAAEGAKVTSSIFASFWNGTTFVVQTFWKNSNISLLSNDFVQNQLVICISIFILATLTYYFHSTRSSQNQSLLILTGLYGTMLPLMLVGTLLGHGLAYKVRYYLPAVIFLIISMSFGIMQQLQHQNQKRQVLGLALLSAILFSSCFSTSNLFVKVLSNKSSGPQLGPAYELVAPVINQAERPLVISDEEYVKVLMFSHRLKPSADLLLLPDASDIKSVIQSQITNYQNSYSEIFIFHPSTKLNESLTQMDINFQEFPQRWSKPVAYQILK
jgi:uncharacterized membrane protein